MGAHIQEPIEELRVFSISDKGAQVIQVNQPLLLISDLLGDELCEAPIGVEDPATRIAPVGYHREGLLRQEERELTERTVLLGEQDFKLELGREDDFVARYHAEVGHADELVVSVLIVLEYRDSL